MQNPTQAPLLYQWHAVGLLLRLGGLLVHLCARFALLFTCKGLPHLHACTAPLASMWLQMKLYFLYTAIGSNFEPPNLQTSAFQAAGDGTHKGHLPFSTE